MKSWIRHIENFSLKALWVGREGFDSTHSSCGRNRPPPPQKKQKKSLACMFCLFGSHFAELTKSTINAKPISHLPKCQLFLCLTKSKKQIKKKNVPKKNYLLKCSYWSEDYYFIFDANENKETLSLLNVTNSFWSVKLTTLLICVIHILNYLIIQSSVKMRLRKSVKNQSQECKTRAIHNQNIKYSVTTCKRPRKFDNRKM